MRDFKTQPCCGAGVVVVVVAAAAVVVVVVVVILIIIIITGFSIVGNVSGKSPCSQAARVKSTQVHWGGKAMVTC